MIYDKKRTLNIQFEFYSIEALTKQKYCNHLTLLNILIFFYILYNNPNFNPFCPLSHDII